MYVYMCTHPQDSSVVSPTKCYLEFLTLPNDDTTQVGLRQVATVTLSHLDRLAQPYSVPDVVRTIIVLNLLVNCLTLEYELSQRM